MIRGQAGQATIAVLGLLMAVLAGALILGGVAMGLGARGDRQRTADLAALAGARAMDGDYAGLFEPPVIDGRRNPSHRDRAAYLARARDAAVRVARRNGAEQVTVSFPDGETFAPVRVRVAIGDPIVVDGRRTVAVREVAEAELAPPAGAADAAMPGVGEYRGKLEVRQGKPMRPDVARAFDRMAAAALEDGVGLIVVSGFRSNAEQAKLFAAHPDPKWVAPPGKSLHRLGTELDLGPRGAYGWLAANATRFGFEQRYSWEPWHYGYVRSPGSTSVGFGRSGVAGGGGDGVRAGALPDFVPAQFRAPILKAAQRWSVSAALLSAQLYAESNFNPFAVSGAGAQGIAQFMPGTARGMGLENPFDAAQAIDAQAHLMHDLLRQFAAVPLALAAYNAGPRPVASCGCVPPFAETRGYVARILGLLGGAGEVPSGGGLVVRLVA